MKENILYREENIYDQENELKRLLDEIENVNIESNSLDEELKGYKNQ